MGNCVICMKPKDGDKNKTFLTRSSDHQLPLPHDPDSNAKKNNSIVIKTNPDNMKLVGVPKKWLKDKKCDPAIVD